MLMSARDEETGEAMTDEQLRVEVTTFLLAGQETTSLALTWTWYLLSQHVDAQRRVEEESILRSTVALPSTPISCICRIRAWSLTRPCVYTHPRGLSHGRR